MLPSFFALFRLSIPYGRTGACFACKFKLSSEHSVSLYNSFKYLLAIVSAADKDFEPDTRAVCSFFNLYE